MNYKIWITENIEKAKKEVDLAKQRLAINEFSTKVFDVVYQLTENDRFSYQVATEFSFERILNSKEFTDEEKKLIQELANNYKNLQ